MSEYSGFTGAFYNLVMTGTGERALMTVVVTDIVGSTALRTRIGDPAMNTVMDEHDKILGEVILQNGGEVGWNRGDGLGAIMSSPSRAIDCAIEMQQAIHLRNRATSAPFEIRVGMSVGEVTLSDGDFRGTPIVEATRLCEAAHGGQILCSDLVLLLAGSHTTAAGSSVAGLHLKGLEAPLATREIHWTPVAQIDLPLPEPLGRLLAGRFVGRLDELGRLDSAWSRAAGGSLQTVVVEGEPGVGKTHLLAGFADQVRRRGGIVMYGRCDDRIDFPYQPLAEALAELGDSCPTKDLKRLLGPDRDELARLAPSLRQNADLVPPADTDDRAADRFRLLEAVAGWLKASSTAQPLLLVVDDLHWATRPTLQLLDHVIQHCHDCRLLLVMTHRSTDWDRDHPLGSLLAGLFRSPHTERIALDGLPIEDVETLITDLSDEDLAPMLDVIFAETDGNPFFVIELTKHFSRPVAGGTAAEHLASANLPASIKEVVAQRRAHLAADTDAVLELASVIGIDFDFAALSDASDADEDSLLLSLDEAVTAGLFKSLADEKLRFAFAHSLIRSAVYEELTPPRRVRLHRRVGEAMERRFPSEAASAAAVAHHFVIAAQAGQPAKAITFTMRAGEEAIAKVAYDEAIQWYETTLRLLDDVPGNHELSRSDVLTQLSIAKWRAGDNTFGETAAAAARCALALADPGRAARALLINQPVIQTSLSEANPARISLIEQTLDLLDESVSADRSRLLSHLALEQLAAGEPPEEIRRLSDQALTMARATSDVTALAEALLRAESVLVHGFNNLDDRLHNTGKLMNLVPRLRDPSLVVAALLVRALAAGDAAQYDEFSMCLDRAIHLAERIRVPSLLYYTRLVESARSALHGDFGPAEALATDAVSYGHVAGLGETDFVLILQMTNIRLQQGRAEELADLASALTEHPDLTTPGQPLMGLALLRAGQTDDAARVLEGLMTVLAERPPTSWKSSHNGLGELCARLGNQSFAARLYEILLPFGHQLHNLALFLPAHAQVLGMLAATLGDFGAAEGHFATAAEIHDAMHSPPLLAATKCEWAAMLLRSGGPDSIDRAEQLLSESRKLAEGCGARQVLTDIDRLPVARSVSDSRHSAAGGR